MTWFGTRPSKEGYRVTADQAEKFMASFWRFMNKPDYNDMATMHVVDWNHNQELIPMGDLDFAQLTERFKRYAVEKDAEDTYWATY